MCSRESINGRCLVIIPDGGLSWHLWCMDYIRKAAQSNQDIVVLDLREFKLDSRKPRRNGILSHIYRRNKISSLVDKLSELPKVEFVRANALDWKRFTRLEYHKKNSKSFRNGLDSEYFEMVGKRVISESQLDNNILLRAKQVFDDVSSVVSYLVQEKEIAKIVVPGGRTLIPAACIAIAQSLGVTSTILESASPSFFGYFEYPFDFRSNTQYLQTEIDRKWKGGDISKNAIAEKYLTDKLYYQSLDTHNFSHSFNASLDFKHSPSDKIATIFVTSGFEFESFFPSDEVGSLGRDHQKQMIKMFSKIALQNGFSLILRGHPPSKGREALYSTEDPDWLDFCAENGITYLPSNSGINSYELIKKSSLNVVYASSVAIDSIILGAQTIILGNAEFSHLIPNLCAFDEKSISDRFTTLTRITRIEEIYPYAFFMSTFGTEMNNVCIASTGIVYYDGKQIDEPRFKFLKRYI